MKETLNFDSDMLFIYTINTYYYIVRHNILNSMILTRFFFGS